MQHLTDFHTKYALLASKTSSSEKVSCLDLPILFLPGTGVWERQMRRSGAPTPLALRQCPRWSTLGAHNGVHSSSSNKAKGGRWAGLGNQGSFTPLAAAGNNTACKLSIYGMIKLALQGAVFHGRVELKFITSVLLKRYLCFENNDASLVTWSAENQQQTRAKSALWKHGL